MVVTANTQIAAILKHNPAALEAIVSISPKFEKLFLISKYSNANLLRWIFVLINAGLLAFVFFFLFTELPFLFLIPVAFIAIALFLFGYYCHKSYQMRIRKQVDGQMKVSLLSVAMMAVPIACLIAIIIMLLFSPVNTRLVLAYGFTIFFGWLTAIILGMTFKTLPFIVWNKKYHAKAGLGQTPNPKDLFSAKVFVSMALSYLFGFFCFAGGILITNSLAIKAGAGLLLCCAFWYNVKVFKILFHKENVS